VEGEKEDCMTTSSTEIAGVEPRAVTALTASRAVSIFAAALLGTFIVGGVGFSHIIAVHNAAHDYRHSMAFPCH
jgi:cobalt transporter subunit CbtB